MKKTSRTISTAIARHEQDRRVHQRGDDLVLQVLFARLEIRDLRQHDVEEAARLARLDHRHIHARERHPASGPSRPPATCRRSPGRGFPSTSTLAAGSEDSLENHQRAAERHARRQQAGQQAREIFQHPRRDLAGRPSLSPPGQSGHRAPCPRRGPEPPDAFAGRADFSASLMGFNPRHLHLAHRLLAIAGFDAAFGEAAVGFQGFVGELTGMGFLRIRLTAATPDRFAVAASRVAVVRGLPRAPW
jgi:hypothetical protein